MKTNKYLALIVLTFIGCASVGVVHLAHAGLDPHDRWGHIVALYRFENTSDSGPRCLDGYTSGEAKIVRGRENGKVLRLRNKGSFHVHSNFDFPLTSGFSVALWVKLKRQNNNINIGMHGSNADGGIAGFASITIKRDGNFYGWHYTSAADQVRLRTKNKNVSDNKWHHIAFTRYGNPANGIYTAYIDGQVAARSSSWDCLCFVADQTNIYIANARAGGTLVGDVFVDDVGFFAIGFSVHEIRALYKNGLNTFIRSMPVDPKAKVATTWAGIKEGK